MATKLENIKTLESLRNLKKFSKSQGKLRRIRFFVEKPGNSGKCKIYDIVPMKMRSTNFSFLSCSGKNALEISEKTQGI